MRHCPICDERYDDESIKFCTKDGTPLVEDGTPNFVILPSEPPADLGDETVIRRKPASGSFASDPERIVVPTADPSEPRIRPRQVFYPQPEPPNTAKVIALTIVGTLVILSFGAGLFWLFQKDPGANINVNSNPVNLNADLNTNLGFNSNFNFNTNFNANANANANYASNYNFNFNFNAPSKTPTRTPTVRPSPSFSPTPIAPPTSPSPKPPPANTNSSTSQPPRMGPRPPVMMSNRPPGNR